MINTRGLKLGFAAMLAMSVFGLSLAGCGGESDHSAKGGSVNLVLTNGTPTPAVGGSSVITATVTDAYGYLVAGKSVAFSYKAKGGYGLVPPPVFNTTTNASGQAAYTVPGNGDRRTLTVTATVDGVSQSVDVRFGAALPAGVIALASADMNFGAAGVYCASQGGRLPRIGGLTAWDGSTPPMAGISVDGFGAQGGSWPAELAGGGSDFYWTGTNRSSGISWYIYNSGYVGINSSSNTGNYHVACVSNLALTNGAPNPAVGGSSLITATVTDTSGAPAFGKTVSFTWTVKGGSGLVPPPVFNTTTNASGQAAYTVSGTGDRYTLTVTATVDGVSQSVDVQFGTALPTGVIALASGTMDWNTAYNYCEFLGGKLPLINGLNNWSGIFVNGVPVDGLGVQGGSWPPLLPNANYWTGTEYGIGIGSSWYVAGPSVINSNVIYQSYLYNVVCVP